MRRGIYQLGTDSSRTPLDSSRVQGAHMIPGFQHLVPSTYPNMPPSSRDAQLQRQDTRLLLPSQQQLPDTRDTVPAFGPGFYPSPCGDWLNSRRIQGPIPRWRCPESLSTRNTVTVKQASGMLLPPKCYREVRIQLLTMHCAILRPPGYSCIPEDDCGFQRCTDPAYNS